MVKNPEEETDKNEENAETIADNAEGTLFLHILAFFFNKSGLVR